MTPLRCMIVDDEPLPLELLRDYIDKTPFLQLAAAFNNPLEALAYLQSNNIDLIFLDIQMPQLTGIQFMHSLNGKSKVIFTSAYPNYALQGYEMDVLDYLLKPVSFERFLKAATKALQLVYPNTGHKPETAVENKTGDEVLFVKTDHKIVKVFLGDILYIEGLKEYIALHTAQGKIITLQTMKKMEALLPDRQFIRVHKSFIVAIDKIDSIERNRVFIKKAVIPIGETYKEVFIKMLDQKSLQ